MASSDRCEQDGKKNGGTCQGVTLRLRDKPQGFEEGKLRRKGWYPCSWGSDKFFRSQDDAFKHDCILRREAFRLLVEMNKRENITPRQVYVDEMNGIRHDTIDHEFDFRSLCNIELPPEINDDKYPPRQKSISSESSIASSYKEISRGLRQTVSKEQRVIDWVLHTNFNVQLEGKEPGSASLVD